MEVLKRLAELRNAEKVGLVVALAALVTLCCIIVFSWPESSFAHYDLHVYELFIVLICSLSLYMCGSFSKFYEVLKSVLTDVINSVGFAIISAIVVILALYHVIYFLCSNILGCPEDDLTRFSCYFVLAVFLALMFHRMYSIARSHGSTRVVATISALVLTVSLSVSYSQIENLLSYMAGATSSTSLMDIFKDLHYASIIFFLGIVFIMLFHSTTEFTSRRKSAKANGMNV